MKSIFFSLGCLSYTQIFTYWFSFNLREKTLCKGKVLGNQFPITLVINAIECHAFSSPLTPYHWNTSRLQSTITQKLFSTQNIRSSNFISCQFVLPPVVYYSLITLYFVSMLWFFFLTWPILILNLFHEGTCISYFQHLYFVISSCVWLNNVLYSTDNH